MWEEPQRVSTRLAALMRTLFLIPLFFFFFFFLLFMAPAVAEDDERSETRLLNLPKKYHQEKVVFDILLFVLKSNVFLFCFLLRLENSTVKLLIGSSKCFLLGGMNRLFGIFF